MNRMATVKNVLKGDFAMNRILGGAVFLLLISTIAAAQDIPKMEVFGGYSLHHQNHWNLNGFTAEYEYNVKSKIGFVGDISYGRKSVEGATANLSPTFENFLLLGGPRFSYRSEKVRIFAHILGGGERLKVQGSTSGYGIPMTRPYTNIAIVFGGGADFPIKGNFSVRLAQLDWVRGKLPDVKVGNVTTHPWVNQFRYSAGIVYKFWNTQASSD